MIFSALINFIIIVREYIEFVANHELILDYITYKDDSGQGIELLRADRITSEKSFVFWEKINCDEDSFFDDLCKWINDYDKHKDVIYLWRKSVYNKRNNRRGQNDV